MSAPHPALLRLARSERAEPIRDENEFLRSAFEHRMVAPVLDAVERSQLGLSQHAVTTASVWQLAERRRHLDLWRTIADVRERLRSLDAEVCVLKGVATEWRWYDRIGDRVATDVDLLLAPSALPNIVEVVRCLQPDRAAVGAIAASTRRRQLQHIDLSVGGVQVDLHLDPLKVGIPTLQLEALWAATELVHTEHGTIRVLRPEHELVLLLLHLNKDRFAYLGPLLDVRRLLERADLDWHLVAEFVRNEGLDVAVYESLAAVGGALDLPIEVSTTGGWLRRRTWRVLWRPSQRLGGDEARRRAPRVQRALTLHVRGRTRDVIREVRRQLWPARELLEVAGRLEQDGSYLRARRWGAPERRDGSNSLLHREETR